MKYKTRVLGSLIFSASMFLGNYVCAELERGTDKTLSPYFFVKSDDPGADQVKNQGSQGCVTAGDE